MCKSSDSAVRVKPIANSPSPQQSKSSKCPHFPGNHQLYQTFESQLSFYFKWQQLNFILGSFFQYRCPLVGFYFPRYNLIVPQVNNLAITVKLTLPDQTFPRCVYYCLNLKPNVSSWHLQISSPTQFIAVFVFNLKSFFLQSQQF